MTLMWYARQRMYCELALHACGRFFNEWPVDTFCRIDDQRLGCLASDQGQTKLRVAEKADVEHYCETITADQGTSAARPGRLLLPSNHQGSKRAMWILLQNALAISARKGKATFFDTMTCNPHWPEIQECLLRHQTAEDRPDLCAAVFKQKLTQVLRAITTGKWHTRWRKEREFRNADGVLVMELEDTILKWRIYVIEYQFRGLPHAHIVYRVETLDGSQLLLGEEIDRVVQARYPTKDPKTGKYTSDADAKHAEMITKHMLHQCTEQCRPEHWRGERCQDGFPFPLCKKTHLDARGFVEYCRLTEEDRYVVPHNGEILIELDCHYCRVVATLSKVLRYLYKYLHKGPDTAASKQVRARDKKQRHLKGDNEPVNEIAEYQYERCVCACEAAWRINGWINHEIWPTVRPLWVDDDGRKRVVIRDDDMPDDPDKLRKKLAKVLSNVDIYFLR
eukprot:gene8530-21023_t